MRKNSATAIAGPKPVPLPAGADTNAELDEWQPGEDACPSYRCVWSPTLSCDQDIRVVAVQYADGMIAAEGEDAPMVYIGHIEYKPATARRIATAILEAADLAERWTEYGVSSSPEVDR